MCAHEHALTDEWMLTIDKDEFFACEREEREALLKIPPLSSSLLTSSSSSSAATMETSLSTRAAAYASPVSPLSVLPRPTSAEFVDNLAVR